MRSGGCCEGCGMDITRCTPVGTTPAMGGGVIAGGICGSAICGLPVSMGTGGADLEACGDAVKGARVLATTTGAARGISGFPIDPGTTVGVAPAPGRPTNEMLSSARSYPRTRAVSPASIRNIALLEIARGASEPATSSSAAGRTRTCLPAVTCMIAPYTAGASASRGRPKRCRSAGETMTLSLIIAAAAPEMNALAT